MHFMLRPILFHFMRRVGLSYSGTNSGEFQKLGYAKLRVTLRRSLAQKAI